MNVDAYQWLPAALIPAQTSLRDRIDQGGLPGAIKVYDVDDTLLATLALSHPCGSLDAAGALTLTPGAPESSAPAGGAAAYAVMEAGDSTPLLLLPVVEGATPLPGYLVISSANIVAGGTVSMVSAQVG